MAKTMNQDSAKTFPMSGFEATINAPPIFSSALLVFLAPLKLVERKKFGQNKAALSCSSTSISMKIHSPANLNCSLSYNIYDF